MKSFKMIACLGAMLVATAAVAQTVEDRRAVLDAQIELLRKQKELQDAQRSLAGTAASGMPVVVSVSVGQYRIARLQLANGIVGHYREGESIRPGMVVSSIAPKQVFVAVGSGKARSAIPLDFAGPVTPSAMGAPGAPGTPSTAYVPDALLPAAPSVTVPAIEIIPIAKAAVTVTAPPAATKPAPAAVAQVVPAAAAAKPASAPPVPPPLKSAAAPSSLPPLVMATPAKGK